MEEFSFANFFKFLILQKIQVPVVETALVQSDFVDCVLSTDEQGFLRKRQFPKPVPVLSYLQKLMEEFEWKSRMHCEKNQKICYFYKKSKKTVVLDSKIKEILGRNGCILNIDLVQKYVEPISSTEKPLVLRLNYLDHQYKAELMYNKVRLNDPIILNMSLDIAIILIHSFEVAQCKRVIQMEIEYVKETPSKIWLSNVQKCVLVEAKYTLNFPLHKPEDHESLIKSLPKTLKQTKSVKTLRDLKLPIISQSRDKGQYIFRKGQLRNAESNVDSPIRITMEHNKEVKTQGQVEKKEDPVNAENTANLNYTCESPDLTNRKSPKKVLINDLLKGFLTVPKSGSTSALIDLRNGPRSPVDPAKRNNSNIRRSQGFMKSLPKISRARKLGYGNDFIELVMNTYCKNKESYVDRSGDFGLACNITSEEFSNFLSNADYPKDLHAGIGEKVIAEESDNSKSQSPTESFPKKMFEFQFVNNILAKRKELLASIKKKRKRARKQTGQKILSLILKSPKSRRGESQAALL